MSRTVSNVTGQWINHSVGTIKVVSNKTEAIRLLKADCHTLPFQLHNH